MKKATIYINQQKDDKFHVTTTLDSSVYSGPYPKWEYAFTYAIGFKDALHKCGYKTVEVDINYR